MKKIILVVGMLTIFLFSGICESATLALKSTWNRNTETDLAGYNVYRTDGARIKINTILIAPTVGTVANPFLWSLTVPDGSSGTIRGVCTAVDTAGNESTDSNEGVYTYNLDTIPPVPPTGFGITKQ